MTTSGTVGPGSRAGPSPLRVGQPVCTGTLSRKMSRVRLAVVLSAGGLRGAAHVGVLRQLVRQGVQIDAIVGVSAGAVVGAYYAAVGLDFDELIHDAEIFRGRHLLAYSVNVRLDHRFERQLAPNCGVIPERLRQSRDVAIRSPSSRSAEAGHRLPRHQIRKTAIFRDRFNEEVSVAAAVRASASIPYLFPPVAATCGGEECRLTDGGVTDSLPLAFARSAAIGATHVVVSDCRWIGRVPPTDGTTVGSARGC